MKDDYQTYLQKLQQSPRTVVAYNNHIEKLKKWCWSKRIDIDHQRSFSSNKTLSELFDRTRLPNREYCRRLKS